MSSHVFVDETKRRGYLLVGGVVVPGDLESVRRMLRGLVLPGQRRLHRKDENDQRRRSIATAIAVSGVTATIYDAGRRMNKNVERGHATRAHLIDLATRLFADNGYGTSIEAVLAESGVGRGSLYHHFAGKKELFWAVLHGISEQVAHATRDAPDPVAALRADCLAWIRLAADPVVQQTILIDAPTVFGWQKWREVNEQSNLGAIRVALTYAADTVSIEQRHIDAFAHMLLAAANEAAMMIARADDPAATLGAGEGAFAELLDRLVGPAGEPAMLMSSVIEGLNTPRRRSDARLGRER